MGSGARRPTSGRGQASPLHFYLDRYDPLCQPLLGVVITQTHNRLVAINPYSKSRQHIWRIGVVFQRHTISAQARATVTTGVPWTHEIDMGYRVIAQRLSKHQLRRSPARVRVPAKVEHGISMPRQDSSHLLRIFNVEEGILRVIVQVALRVAV